MPASIINGREIAKIVINDVKKTLAHTSYKETHITIIQVGDNPASNRYVKLKQQDADECNINCEILKLPADITSTSTLLSVIRDLNGTKSVHGIMVQLPLPDSIDVMEVMRAIDLMKDIDGLNPMSAGLLSQGYTDGFVPATVLAIDLILRNCYDHDPKNVCIVGRSNLVGKPLANLLINEGKTVTVCNSHTEELYDHVRMADTVILAAGRMDLFHGSAFSEGSCIIEVSTNFTSDGKIVGDIASYDYPRLIQKCKWISKPVNGVGPVTRAMLMTNAAKAFYMQAAKNQVAHPELVFSKETGFDPYKSILINRTNMRGE